MRKTVLWVIGIIAVMVVLAKAPEILTLAKTVAQGAIIPIIIAAVLELGRYVVQSFTLTACFEAVGETASWKKMMPLVFSGIFINTIAPTGGTAGTVLILDDAHSRGIPIGKATSTALLYQIGLYTGFIIIMFIGFIILQVTGHLDAIAFLAGMVMVCVATFFSGIIFFCRKNPELLLSLFKPIEHWVEKLFTKFKRTPPKPWAENLISAASDAAAEIANNPRGLANILGFAVLGSGIEMLAFICVGLSFGLTAINVLVAGYVVTNLFTVVSPTPNGVGFAEVAASLILTSYGNDPATATAVALVFRGFVFWIPFAVGAVLLRRTDFFSVKEDETAETAFKHTARIAGLFVFALGAANVVFALLPSVPEGYELLDSLISIGSLFSGTYAVLLGIALMLMTRGIMRQSRTSWAWTLVLLVFLAAAQFINGHTWYAGLPLLALAVFLFVKRDCFDCLLVHENMRSTVVPIIYAVVMTLCYGLVGFIILGDHFAGDFGFISIPVQLAQTFVPFLGTPHAVDAYGTWLVQSIRMVAVFTAGWAVIAILFPWLRKRRREVLSIPAPTPQTFEFRLSEHGLLQRFDPFAPEDNTTGEQINIKELVDKNSGNFASVSADEAADADAEEDKSSR